jgi:stearoyl-CoA desaturase (Delta-9 desaturase)
MDDLRAAAERARARAREWLSEVQLPHVPTTEELRSRVQEMFAHAPSPDEVAERAREILLDRIAHGLLGEPESLRGAS